MRGGTERGRPKGATEGGTVRGKEGKKEKAPAGVCLQGLKNLGWEMGLEPTTTGITIRDSTN